MKAVIVDGNKKLSVVKTETPKADGNNVIIKVSTSGICGSDIHIWKDGDNHKGLIMGHEFCGTVYDPGALRGTLSVGDRVTALPINPCGTCKACREGNVNFCPETWNDAIGLQAPGAFAEYVSVRPDMVRELSDSISDVDAAMIEPAAVSIRAVYQAGVKLGDKVLVVGTGIIGLLAAAWARRTGASYVAVVGRNAMRNKKAVEMGDADDVFSSRDSDMLKLLVEASQGGFDKVIDCVGTSESFSTAVNSAISGGRIVLAGVGYEPLQAVSAAIVVRELSIIGSIAYTSMEFELCMDLLTENKINLKRFASKPVELENVQEAFERLSAGTNQDVKIILKP